jgi:hypothetical protein
LAAAYRPEESYGLYGFVERQNSLSYDLQQFKAKVKAKAKVKVIPEPENIN